MSIGPLAGMNPAMLQQLMAAEGGMAPMGPTGMPMNPLAADGFGGAAGAQSTAKLAESRGLLGPAFGAALAHVREDHSFFSRIVSMVQFPMEAFKALSGLWSNKPGAEKLKDATNAFSSFVGIFKPEVDARHDKAENLASLGIGISQKLGATPTETMASLTEAGAGGAGFVGVTDNLPGGSFGSPLLAGGGLSLLSTLGQKGLPNPMMFGM